MLRSLNSGISGMKANQDKMDVIGNNIANVGTTAFKGGSVRFEDMFSQATKTAAGATNSSGGVNSNQVGLGVQVASVDTMMVQGLMQSTGRNLDVGIDGEGYFMVGKGKEICDVAPATPPTPLVGIGVDNTGTKHPISSNGAGMNINYTRDGSFNLDDSGNLVTSDGSRVLGYSVKTLVPPTTPGTQATTTGLESIGKDASNKEIVNKIDISNGVVASDTGLVTLKIPDTIVTDSTTTPPTTAKVTSYSIGKDGLISASLDDGSVTVIGQIAMASFSNPAGLTNIGNNQFKISSNSGGAIIKSGINNTVADNSKGYGEMNSGSLEMSNVDLASQFTDMIVTNRAFQANSKTITTSDEMLQDLIGLVR